MKIAFIIVVVLIMINILAWNVIRRDLKYEKHDNCSNQYVSKEMERFNKKASMYRNFNISIWALIVCFIISMFIILGRPTHNVHQPMEIQSYISMSLRDYNK